MKNKKLIDLSLEEFEVAYNNNEGIKDGLDEDYEKMLLFWMREEMDYILKHLKTCNLGVRTQPNEVIIKEGDESLDGVMTGLAKLQDDMEFFTKGTIESYGFIEDRYRNRAIYIDEEYDVWYDRKQILEGFEDDDEGFSEWVEENMPDYYNDFFEEMERGVLEYTRKEIQDLIVEQLDRKSVMVKDDVILYGFEEWIHKDKNKDWVAVEEDGSEFHWDVIRVLK